MPAMIDLYSTLVHESPDNPFYRVVPAELDLDPGPWREAHRRLGRDSMTGRLPDMAARVAAGCELVGQPRDRQIVESVVAAAMELFYEAVKVDPDTFPLLDRLRGLGHRVGIVSNASFYSDELLARTGLAQICDAVVFSCRVGTMKPDPAIYHAAGLALGAPLKACLFIGDGGDDELRGAKSVGLTTVLVDRGLPHSDAARPWADYVVQKLIDAAEALEPATGRREQ